MNSEVSGFLLSQGISETAEHLMQSEAGTIVVTWHWRVASVFEIWVSSSPWVAMWYDVHDWIHDCKFGDGVFGHWLKAPTSARSCAVPYPHVRVSYWQHSLPTKLGVTDWFWLSQSSFLHAIEQLEAWYRFPDAMVSSLGMHKTSKHIWSSLKHRFPRIAASTLATNLGTCSLFQAAWQSLHPRGREKSSGGGKRRKFGASALGTLLRLFS